MIPMKRFFQQRENLLTPSTSTVNHRKKSNSKPATDVKKPGNEKSKEGEMPYGTDRCLHCDSNRSKPLPKGKEHLLECRCDDSKVAQRNALHDDSFRKERSNTNAGTNLRRGQITGKENPGKLAVDRKPRCCAECGGLKGEARQAGHSSVPNANKQLNSRRREASHIHGRKSGVTEEVAKKKNEERRDSSTSVIVGPDSTWNTWIESRVNNFTKHSSGEEVSIPLPRYSSGLHKHRVSRASASASCDGEEAFLTPISSSNGNRPILLSSLSAVSTERDIELEEECKSFSTIHAQHRRRIHSDRSYHRTDLHLIRTNTGPVERSVPRASSLRVEAIARLPSLFTNRSKLMEWPEGVAPRVLYAAETYNELDDGLGIAGLSATSLCKMGERYRSWDVVRERERFQIRIVGWHGGEMTSNPDRQAGGRVVVYSLTDGNRENAKEVSVVHDECDVNSLPGYHHVSERRGRVVGQHRKLGDYIRMAVGIWMADGVSDESLDASVEIRWRLLETNEPACGIAKRNRQGALLMRYGYYFFLSQPYVTRLFTNTDTPEHVRLVARRAVDGSIDEEFSKTLTYVVIRITAD